MTVIPPVVPVKRRRPNRDYPQYEVWTIDCPWCGREHDHSGEPGHRVAHCLGDNPGYVLADRPSSPLRDKPDGPGRCA